MIACRTLLAAGFALILASSALADVADEEFCYPPGSNSNNAQLHVSAQDVIALQAVDFPVKPMPVTIETAATRAVSEFQERFPGADVPAVASIELQRFPEKYGKDKFYYLILLRPAKTVNRDQRGTLLETKNYHVIIPASEDTNTRYTPACRVIPPSEQ